MPIYFACSECQQKLAISTRKAGSVVNCPRCGSAERVPSADQVSGGGASLDVPGSCYVGVAASQRGESSSSDMLAASEPQAEDSRYLLISRRVLYLQAVLIAVVAAIAFGAGYLVGAATRQNDASAPDISVDRSRATDY